MADGQGASGDVARMRDLILFLARTRINRQWYIIGHPLDEKEWSELLAMQDKPRIIATIQGTVHAMRECTTLSGRRNKIHSSVVVWKPLPGYLTCICWKVVSLSAHLVTFCRAVTSSTSHQVSLWNRTNPKDGAQLARTISIIVDTNLALALLDSVLSIFFEKCFAHALQSEIAACFFTRSTPSAQNRILVMLPVVRKGL